MLLGFRLVGADGYEILGEGLIIYFFVKSRAAKLSIHHSRGSNSGDAAPARWSEEAWTAWANDDSPGQREAPRPDESSSDSDLKENS